MSAQKKKSGILRWVLLAILLVAAFALFRVFGPNTGALSKGNYLYIHTGATYADVKRSLKEDGFIKDMLSFNLLAKQVNYPAHVHAGKYKITAGMSNYNIIRMLRSGRQTPVKLVINKLRTKEDFVHLVSANLEADSNSVKQLLNDSAYLSAYNLDTNTAMCAVMPDTYEFFWNTNADKAFKKIAKTYVAYWNDTRKQEAAAKQLTPAQVVTVASILEEETNKNDEKPNIASVYLNRLKAGVRLQADPTVKFAVNDFTLRRITGAYTQIPSPYNTYLNTGLPPGPICTPSKASIEAVLHAPDTNLMYFCARADFSGYHAFAATLAEHQKNARAYQQALNERGIH